MAKYIPPTSNATARFKKDEKDPSISYVLITDPSRGMEYSIRLHNWNFTPQQSTSMVLSRYQQEGVLGLEAVYGRDDVLQTHDIERFRPVGSS